MTPRAPDSGIVLSINAGSSSIKYAVFEPGDGDFRRVDGGRVDPRAGAGGPGEQVAEDFARAGATILDRLSAGGWLSRTGAVGHRVVHSGVHVLDHQRVTPDLLETLRAAQPLDLAHLPAQIALIGLFGDRLQGVPQVACFDTAFHRGMPRIARLLPIPRRYDEAGVHRLGFHGLSFAFLMDELERLDAVAARGRVILAHLGAGASLSAVRDGRSFDTSMAFTPTAGLVMATRPGDIDAGLLVYLQKQETMSPAEMDAFVSNQCGLLGVSGITGDVKELLRLRADDVRAAEAVELFCYQARKWVGAFAAALGGLDTLVFSGGIGENAALVRESICEGLEFLGITIDGERNATNDAVISTPASRVTVRVVPTDEERMIARSVRRVLSGEPQHEHRSGPDPPPDRGGGR